MQVKQHKEIHFLQNKCHKLTACIPSFPDFLFQVVLLLPSYPNQMVVEPLAFLTGYSKHLSYVPPLTDLMLHINSSV